MTSSRSKKKLCQCCGTPTPRENVAAKVTMPDDTELVWCFDCWDYDEAAVNGYRLVSAYGLSEVKK